ELGVDDGQARVPEAGVGQVAVDDAAQLLGPAGAAGGQQLEVPGHELVAALDVAGVDGQGEQLAVRVGVDVARGADEVRDVAPPAAVPVGDLHGVAEQVALGAGPVLGEVV